MQVEMLYQRYFLRMNQSNTTHILSLLLALVLSLAAVHIILIPMESTSQFYKTLQRNRYNDTVNGNGSYISSALNRSDNIANYTPNANSQQHFVRLNYNYSTDNETGNWLFIFVWHSNCSSTWRSSIVNAGDNKTAWHCEQIKSINNTHVNIVFWISKWVTVNIRTREMARYSELDAHMMKWLWTIWRISNVLCRQHQKRVISTIIIVMLSSKRVKDRNAALHQI